MPRTSTQSADAAAVAAALAAEQELSNSVSAFEEAKAAFFNDVNTLGRMHAAGKASLTDVAMQFGRAVGEKILTSGDNVAVYMAFLAGHNSSVSLGVEQMPTDEKNVKVPASIFGTFAKPIVAHLTDTLWRQVLTVRHGIPTTQRKHTSAYNALVTVNRAAQDLAKANGESVATGYTVTRAAMTDDWVRGLIAKPEADGKSDIDKLIDALGRVAKMADPESEGAPYAGSCLLELLTDARQFATIVKSTGKAPTDVSEVRAKALTNTQH